MTIAHPIAGFAREVNRRNPTPALLVSQGAEVPHYFVVFSRITKKVEAILIPKVEGMTDTQRDIARHHAPAESISCIPLAAHWGMAEVIGRVEWLFFIQKLAKPPLPRRTRIAFV